MDEDKGINDEQELSDDRTGPICPANLLQYVPQEGRPDKADYGRIDDYYIVGKLGSGTYGVVLQAESLTGDHFALKLLFKSSGPDDEYRRQRFQRECDLLRIHSGDWPFLPKYIGTGTLTKIPETAGQPYLVMELIKGLTLFDWAKSHVHTTEFDLIAIGYQLAMSVRSMHESGVYHRDLACNNIIFEDKSHHIRIIDLGCAKDPKATIDLTIGPLGNWYTIDPTVLLGKTATAQSDLFSIGCILHYVWSGEYPWTRDPHPTREAKSGVPTFNRDDKLQLSDKFKIAVQKLLVFDRNVRTSCVDEFLSDLQVARSALLEKFGADIHPNETAKNIGHFRKLMLPDLVTHSVAVKTVLKSHSPLSSDVFLGAVVASTAIICSGEHFYLAVDTLKHDLRQLAHELGYARNDPLITKVKRTYDALVRTFTASLTDVNLCTTNGSPLREPTIAISFSFHHFFAKTAPISKRFAKVARDYTPDLQDDLLKILDEWQESLDETLTPLDGQCKELQDQLDQMRRGLRTIIAQTGGKENSDRCEL